MKKEKRKRMTNFCNQLQVKYISALGSSAQTTAEQQLVGRHPKEGNSPKMKEIVKANSS